MATLGQRELTHDEMWDDSAMVDTWNAAQKEYEIYHSINAKGERLEDILSNSNSEDISGVVPKLQNDSVSKSPQTAGPVESDQHRSEFSPSIDINASQPPEVHTKGHLEPAHTPLTVNVPETLLANQNESMKNLMMSWYYAGYYTGLYEGQKASQSERHASKE